MTDTEARQLLRVSRTTLWRLRRSEELPFVRVGGEVRYRERDLQCWLKQQTPAQPGTPTLSLDNPRSARETQWKNAVEEQDWDFWQDDTSGLTHALHPYPAKFPPSIPSRLLELLATPGQVVLDPFCGCGTTLVEARRLGYPSIGSDINPVAVLVSKAKTIVLNTADLEVLLALGRAVNRAAALEAGEAPLFFGALDYHRPFDPPPIPNRPKWFSPVAVRELGMLKSYIHQVRRSRAQLVAEAVFSAIIGAVSNQDSETRYVAREKSIAAGDALSRFAKKLGTVVEMHKSWRSYANHPQPRVILADTRALSKTEVGSVDLIVTSPPYANAFDYHLYHRHRLYWLGHDPAMLRDREIGSHLNHQREVSGITAYRADMEKCLQRIRRCLKPGGVFALVVGDSVFHGIAVDNSRLIADAAREHGYRCIASATRHLHPIKRSVIGPARRAKAETILLLVRED